MVHQDQSGSDFRWFWRLIRPDVLSRNDATILRFTREGVRFFVRRTHFPSLAPIRVRPSNVRLAPLTICSHVCDVYVAFTKTTFSP